MSEISIENYSPMDPQYQQDPFPHYAALRDQAPIFRHANGIIFVSRMAEVQAVLQDPRTYSSRWGNTAGVAPIPGAEKELAEITKDDYPPANTMLTADPPAQTRYRKTVGRAFSTRRIKALEQWIREATVELIEAWPERGRVDFMREFSIPLPVRVIGRALGLPADRADDIKRWSDASVASIGVHVSKEEGLAAARDIVALHRYLASEIEDRQREPRADFLSELVDANFEDQDGTVRKLDIPEMISIVQQLIVAGNEATTKGINEILKLLIENPDEWKRIQEDPSRVPAMVEEGMRLASPNQGLFRIATSDTELAGVPVPKGSMLWVMFGSANRDEGVFPDPDRFDPGRTNLNEHVAFGRGAHFCIGAPLARLENKVLFEELAQRVESLSFAPGTTLEYEPSFILRGLRELEIEVVRR